VKLSDIGEFGLIKLLADEFGIEYPPRPGTATPGFIVALGDDAVVTEKSNEAVIWTTDTMVAGEHFRLEFCSWQDVGWKSLASNVSDVAAMGGTPHIALVTLMLPSGFCVDDALELYRGLHACASEFGVTLGGGDIVRSPVFAITVALSGHAAQPNDKTAVLRRDTARPGDLVAVTGTLGDSGGGLLLLQTGRQPISAAEKRLVQAHLRPVPRVKLGAEAIDHGLRCGMDVSDGLVQDLGHIAAASQAEIVVEASRLPLSQALREVWPGKALALALAGGEDYELVLVGPRAAMDRFVAAWTDDVTVIGRVEASNTPNVTVLDEKGAAIGLEHGGWNHFTSP
jgi:thiamine-monophosphate kinase